MVHAIIIMVIIPTGIHPTAPARRHMCMLAGTIIHDPGIIRRHMWFMHHHDSHQISAVVQNISRVAKDSRLTVTMSGCMHHAAVQESGPIPVCQRTKVELIRGVLRVLIGAENLQKPIGRFIGGRLTIQGKKPTLPSLPLPIPGGTSLHGGQKAIATAPVLQVCGQVIIDPQAPVIAQQ